MTKIQTECNGNNKCYCLNLHNMRKLVANTTFCSKTTLSIRNTIIFREVLNNFVVQAFVHKILTKIHNYNGENQFISGYLHEHD